MQGSRACLDISSCQFALILIVALSKGLVLVSHHRVFDDARSKGEAERGSRDLFGILLDMYSVLGPHLAYEARVR